MSYFHVDAFLLFVAIGLFFSMLIKNLVHRVQRWVRHVKYMQKKAGGTLIVDPEADYWLKLIKHPWYRPIWRWHYDKVWKQMHPKGAEVRQRRMTPLRKLIAVIIAILLIFITMVSVFGVPNLVPPPVPTETRMDVNGWSNLTLTYYIGDIGYSFDLDEAANWTSSNSTYPGGSAALFVEINRLDAALEIREVFLNVSSSTFLRNDTRYTYLEYVEYWWTDGSGLQYANVTMTGMYDQNGLRFGQFGHSFALPSSTVGAINLFMVLQFTSFDNYFYEHLVTLNPEGSTAPTLIYGGYYDYNPPYRGL